MIFHLVFIPPFFVKSTVSADYPLNGSICYGNETTNTAYKNNVDSLLANLAPRTTVSPPSTPVFYYNITGQDPNKAYGSYLCRVDVPLNVCRECVEKAKESLLKRDSYKECFSFEEEYVVRYANHSIYSIYQEGRVLAFGSRGVNVSNPQEYNQTLSDTLESLVKEAALGNWSRAFAIRAANVTGSGEKIYALVQCTLDISAVNCRRCLGKTYSYVQKYTGNAQGGVVFHTDCQMRYDNRSFLYNGNIVQNNTGHRVLRIGYRACHYVMLLSVYYIYMTN